MLSYLFHSVWAQLSLATIVVIGLLALAWFVPFLRKWAIGAAGLVAGAAAIYAKGASDAANRAREKQAAAEKQAIESGKADRAAAEHDAAGGVRDGYNRD